MTAWTRDTDIKNRMQKKWDSGEILALSVSGSPFEPFRIPLKSPSSKALTHEFEVARDWVAHLARHARKPSGHGYDLEYREISHKTLGRNKVPEAVVFQSLEDLTAYLGKTRETTRYQALYKTVTARFPALGPMLRKSPLDALAHESVMDRILAIAAHLLANPHPSIYLRELDISGVDTKFIEAHKAYLTKVLDAVLPPGAINGAFTGASHFENRYGFLSKPGRIRFRILDPELAILGLKDMEIPVKDFCELPISPDTVFIIENEITGLSFPLFPRAMVIFGLGYGLRRLSGARWMEDKHLWYWGDIDTHGFVMIDQIRHYFPRTRSFLMDEETLLSHQALWGSESSPAIRDLTLLTQKEAALYDALRKNRFAPSLRLEQERISFSNVQKAVEAILNGPGG